VSPRPFRETCPLTQHSGARSQSWKISLRLLGSPCAALTSHKARHVLVSIAWPSPSFTSSLVLIENLTGVHYVQSEAIIIYRVL
jgi:hypothetical protein